MSQIVTWGALLLWCIYSPTYHSKSRIFFRDAFFNQGKEASRTNTVRQSHMYFASPLTGRCSTRTLNDGEIEEGPAVKKRKLGNGISASQGVQSQPSFADVLERLKKEEGANATGVFGLLCGKRSTYLSGNL
jgi:hypothetical protein